MVFMFMTGIGMMIQLAGSNTMLQTIVDDDKRGRVMSFYAMSFRGMAPFGSLLAGAAAGIIGAPLTLIIGGGFCLGGSLYFMKNLPAMRKLIRPIYIKMGIISESVKGVGTATSLPDR